MLSRFEGTPEFLFREGSGDEKKEMSIESQIEKLEGNERKFFEIRKRTQEAISKLDVSHHEEKLSDQDWKNIRETINFLQEEAVRPLVKEIGRERIEKIDDLLIKQLEKETEENISKAISGVNDTTDEKLKKLYKVIYGSGSLWDTPAEELVGLIGGVIERKISLNFLTRRAGLREGVATLLEQKKNNSNPNSFKTIFKR